MELLAGQWILVKVTTYGIESMREMKRKIDTLIDEKEEELIILRGGFKV